MSDAPGASGGLRSPRGTPLAPIEPRRPWTPGRIALQVIGLALGLSLFGWALSLALGEENRASLEAMRSAPAREVGLLVALTFASLLLNGLMFWVVLRPVQRLRPVDVTLVNAIATFLSILPFKLSLVTRMAIHHRRDGVRFRTLVAWVAAMGALGLAVLLPFMAATLWRGAIDAWWWAASLAGVLACSAMGVVLGRLADRFALLRVLSFGSHAIVRHTAAVAGHGVFRLIDVAVLAGRFFAGAAIVDVAMPADQAVLLATTYFLLSVLTPAGTLGFREMGVAALGFAQGLDQNAIALVALVVTASEVLTSGVMAGFAFFWLRVDRVLAGERGPAAPISSPADAR